MRKILRASPIALIALAAALCLPRTAPAEDMQPDQPAEVRITQADRTAIRGVIEAQLAAFRRDDGEAAFSYAAPGIQKKFRTPEDFMRMVRIGYRPVYRPRRFVFQDLVTVEGNVFQRAYVIGPGGEEATALYLMLRQPDGLWKIGGCALLRPREERT